MRDCTSPAADAPGHDSFLDIVANMVGILIILVMVVAMRVKHTAVVTAIGSGDQQLAAALQRELDEERSLRAEVLQAAEAIEQLRAESLIQQRQRDLLAVAVAALEHRIRSRRQQLNLHSREAFDLHARIDETRARLDDLLRRRAQAEQAAAGPTVVESYPTPLSRTVHGQEAHFQLRGGRIVEVPLGELLDELKSQFRQKSWRLLERREITDTLGPIGGFRLRYTLRRYDISPQMAMELGRSGSLVRLERAEFLPLSDSLGEPIDAAWSEGSEFRKALGRYHPGRSTVTVWTYADSFAAFRQLKERLYRMGYAVAARPLPLGTPISGSPAGSKSAAE